ncbi:Uncharacterised protein [Mycobacteroides abscessus subsp. abscessus]|nr:Uncharacterised protein [Mycobacteroides abscessus subsp. abscessus]
MVFEDRDDPALLLQRWYEDLLRFEVLSAKAGCRRGAIKLPEFQ